MVGSYLNQGTLALPGSNLPQDNTMATPWLTVTGNATLQLYTSYGGGIAPPSPNMFENVMSISAGATLTIDDVLSTNLGNSGNSSDNDFVFGITGSNLPVVIRAALRAPAPSLSRTALATRCSRMSAWIIAIIPTHT